MPKSDSTWIVQELGVCRRGLYRVVAPGAGAWIEKSEVINPELPTLN